MWFLHSTLKEAEVHGMALLVSFLLHGNSGSKDNANNIMFLFLQLNLMGDHNHLLKGFSSVQLLLSLYLPHKMLSSSSLSFSYGRINIHGQKPYLKMQSEVFNMLAIKWEGSTLHVVV